MIIYDNYNPNTFLFSLIILFVCIILCEIIHYTSWAQKKHFMDDVIEKINKGHTDFMADITKERETYGRK